MALDLGGMVRSTLLRDIDADQRDEMAIIDHVDRRSRDFEILA